MNIKKIIVDDNKIDLSSDKHKINCIFGENGSGKTILFNKIKSFFADKKESEIIFNEDKKIRYPDLMFIEYSGVVSRDLSFEHIWKNRKLSDEKLDEILYKTREIISTMGLYNNIKKINGSVSIDPASSWPEYVTIFFIILVLVREKFEPDLPLIIDSGIFERTRPDKLFPLFEFLVKNVNQLLVFFSDTFSAPNFTQSGSLPGYEQYFYDNNLIGNVFKLKNHYLYQHRR